jgi:GTP-binding protein Era
VAIIGKPNVGKSTILNYLVGEKVAIVSPRRETTRDKILGILSEKNFQIIFIDTPGIHRPKHLLGKEMVRQAESAFAAADLILFVIDAREGFLEDEARIIQLLPKDKKTILLINKIDLIRKNLLLPLIAEAAKKNIFREIIPICATKGDNLAALREKIITLLPEGQAFYPAEQLTDKNERFCAAEIVREKTLEFTRQEVPQAVAVLVEETKDRENAKNLVYIRAIIFVEKHSQKKIMVGKNGEMLKTIGQAARKDIEDFLDKKVYLDLWVKVWENWRQDPQALRELGYIR